MADKTDTLWSSVEAMPEYQAASPQEKMGYATYFLQKASDSMAGDLANNADAQELFRDRSKQFLFKIAEDHFPNALVSIPSQVGESFAREGRAMSRAGIDRLNTSTGFAQETLASLAGKPDSEIVPGNPMTSPDLQPDRDMTVADYRKQLEAQIASNAERRERESEALANSFAESAKRTPSKAMMQWALSDGSIGLDDFISKNWKNEKGGVSKAVDFVGSLGALVLGANLESSVPSAKGMVAGIGTTLATGNPIAGGVAMGTAAANTEFQATYLSELQTELQTRGGDVSAKAINDVLSDPEWNARVDKKAATRGVTIGATEGVAGMLSFGIAKAIGTNTLKRTLLSSVAGTATDMTGGSGGEFLARLFSGDDIWSTEARKDMVIEGLSESGQGVTGVATELIRSGGRNEQGQQEASLSDSSQSEQQPQSPSTDEQQSATPPDADDAPVRSLLEEFKDPATEAEPAPEAATPVVETPAAEPAPVESPAPAPEETAGVAEVAAPDLMSESAVDSIALDPIQLDDQLELRFRQDGDRVQVEKFNTETGNTIPFVGAEDGFASKADAVAFVRDQFNIDENADVVDVPDAKPIEETDPLMELLQREKMRPPQSNIAAFGNRYRREQKGLRTMQRDSDRIGDFEGAPLVRDYEGEAANRLRSIYSRDSSNTPDTIAQMAFNNEGRAPLIAAPNKDALFDAIKQRLGGNLTSEASMTEDPETMGERYYAERSNNAEKFLRSLTSPFRRGGMLDGRQLQEGDVLQIGSDRVTVGTRQGEVVNLRSERYGESYPVGLDDKVGFDAMEEGGIPVSEREATSPENVVTREEAATLTEFIRQRLGAGSRARVVSSREHSALTRSRKELEAARRLAKLFGHRLVGVEGFPPNGAVSRHDNGNIFIATDSDQTELLVVAHELMHQLRQQDSELYDELLSALGVEYDDQGNLTAVGADLQAYIDQVRPGNAGKSDSALIEEYLADYLAERAADPKFWEGLATRDPSMFERFVEFVRNFLYELADRISRDKIEVERYLRDQATMREALERTVAAFAARKRQADAGILDVSLSESLPFDEDLPFADRRDTRSGINSDSSASGEDIAPGSQADYIAGSIYVNGGFVTNANGAPIDFFHGNSSGEFDKFDASLLGSNTGADSAKEAFFGTDSIDVASFYTATDELAEESGFAGFTGAVDVIRDLEYQIEEHADSMGLEPEEYADDWFIKDLLKKIEEEKEWIQDGLRTFRNSGHVKRFYLKSSNPKVLDWGGKSTSQKPLGDAIRDAKKDGHDAVIFENVIDPMFPSTVIAFFDSEQAIPSNDPSAPGQSGVDIRFADRKTKPNQLLVGQDVGVDEVRFADRGSKDSRQAFGKPDDVPDDVHGKDLVQAAVREQYFDSTDPAHIWSRNAAIQMLDKLESGKINPSAETGFHAANQVLIGELKSFGLKVLREMDDDILYLRLKGRENDYFDREATRAARGLNARGWYVRQLDQLLGDVEKGKRNAVNKEAGTDANGKAQDAAAEVGKIQRDLDSIKVAWEDFTEEEKAEFTRFITENRGDVESKQAEKTANLLSGGKKAGARVSKLAKSKKVSDYFSTGGSDMMFSERDLSRQDRELMIRGILEDQLTESKKRKRGVFLRNLTELGMSEEAAGARFLEAAEIREIAKKERQLDAADAKAGKSKQIDENDPESVRRAIQEKAMAALDEESGRLDKLNEKARKISERLAKGPKKRQKPDPASKSELDRLVQSAIEAGDAFSREDTVKAGLQIGLKQEAASALADAIATEIKNRGARKSKPKTINDRAKAIAERFNNPESRAQRAPDPLRKLVNAVLRKDSTLTEADFMAQAKALGVTQPEAADLWQALATERQKRAELRELLRMEREARKATDEAGSIIKRLAASQSDTQDNRPAEKREQAIRAIYQDFVSHGAYGERQGPAMSRAGFVAALVAEGVKAAEADMLATLATRERQNRLDTAHGKAAVAAVERSVPYIMREILAHPLLRSVGPEERLRIMARIFEDRAGMTPEKARAAAVQFDTQLRAKWEKAATELAEQYAAKRNSPFFRREGAVTIGKIFDAMSESRDVAPIQEAFERMIANGETKSAIASALEGMGVAKGTADRLATLGLRPERVQKTLFDKVREAVRAGALDPRRRVLDEVAKANGWVDLTETELRELSTLDAALDDKDLTDFEAVRIKKRMARIVNGSNLNPETKKLIREYLLANMFSGPRTWGVQLSTFFSQGYNVLIRDLAAAAAGSAMGSDSINLKGWTSAMMNWTNHVRNAVADGGVALLEGQVRGVQEAEIMNAISALEGVFDRNLAIWENPRSSRAQKAAAMSKVVLSSVRFFLRILGGLDGLAQGMIRAWVTDLEQFSQAAGFGMSRKEIRQMVGEVMLLRPEFERIADSKGFRGPSKMAYVNDRLAMAMHGALSGQGIPADVLESIKDRSFRESAMETGVNDFEKGTFQLPSLVAKKAVEIVHEGPFWVTWILPVIRTAFNLFHRGAWHGPYGLVRLANVGIKTGGFRTWKDADGKVLSPYENSLADPSQLARRSVEAIVGTAIWTGLIALIAGELEKDDEDRLFRINLGGPSPGDRTRFTAWRRDGRRPFTLQFRADKNADWQTHGFRGGAWEVFNFPLTLLGAWDQKDYSMMRNKGPFEAYAWTLWWELVGETFFPLRSMASRSNIVRSDQIAGRAAYTISSLFPASAALRTPMKFRDYQDHEGPAAAFASQIPVLQLTMEDTPRLNSLGDPIGANESSWSYVGSVFGVPVGSVPASKPWVPGTPATDDNVYQLFGKMDYFPGMVDRSDLPEDVAFATYRDLVIRRGTAIKKFVKDHYAQLAKMEPEQFKKEVRDFTTKATKSLKAQMKL